MSATASKLIQSLQNPIIYPYHVKKITLIETHISWVILSGLYAYKIKKPVNFGFLDFSSLEKRHFYCCEEIRLHRRLAPNLYLDVVAITGNENNPVFDGTGRIIEYAVKMRQFDPNQTFDQLIARQQLTPQHVKESAKIIASFHKTITHPPNTSRFGHADTVLTPVLENFRFIRKLENGKTNAVLNHLTSWSEQRYRALKNVFDQRRQHGFVRECHGDLHLGNIALIDAQVVPFDGIEFNPDFIWIDVINDIAFLIMDLHKKQRPDLAFQFLNCYLENSGDYEGLKLLPFYQVYRAMVRAKIAGICANDDPTGNSHQRAIDDPNTYLKLAQQFTHPDDPALIIMHGLSGSGKSWLSQQIASRQQLIRLRSDIERKRLFKRIEGGRSTRRNLYSQHNRDQIYAHLLALSKLVLSCGYGVIVDATFLRFDQRQPFAQLTQQLQIPFVIIHTKVDDATRLQRMKQRAREPDNVSDANLSIIEQQRSTLQMLTAAEQLNSITINTAESHRALWKFLDARCHSQKNYPSKTQHHDVQPSHNHGS